jgi:short-subunit dehydrogenase
MTERTNSEAQRTGLRVVITGASSGIGAATAIAFARQGAWLVLAARGEAGLDEVARACRQEGAAVQVKVLDTTDEGAVASLAGEVRDALGGIDLWFSCVGIGVVGRYEDVPLADHQRVIETNLISHMNDAHAVLPIFLAQDHGTWVNMISVLGFIAAPYAAAYSASKFGLRGFSQSLRAELSKKPRIHICDIYPNFVDTPAVDHAGNYTGAKLSLPPGSVAPESVAKAVVRLAKRPRNTTVVGAPAIALKLGAFAVPNLSPAVMNGFMDYWIDRADPGDDTRGSLFAAPRTADGIDGGRRHPERRRKAGLVTGALASLGAAGLMAAWWRRRG